MKPKMQTIEHEQSERTEVRRFPVTDFNYHSMTLGGFSGPCARRVKGSSFYRISNDYFKGEANNYFLAEAAVFATILATVAFPLINGAQAVIHLVRILSGV